MKPYLFSLILSLSLVAYANPAPVLSAEQTIAFEQSILAQIQQSSQETFYYTAHSELSAKPVKDGFFRKVLGQTKDGRYIVQDFYANGRKQSSPFILSRDEQKQQFVDTKIDGIVYFYKPDGELILHSVYENGEEQQQLYYFNSKPYVKYMKKDDYLAMYRENGQIEIEYTADSAIYYHENGQKIAEIVNSNPEKSKLWNEQGIELSAENLEKNPQGEQIMFTVMVNMLGSMMKFEAYMESIGKFIFVPSKSN